MFKTIFECLSCIMKAFKRSCGGQVSDFYTFNHAYAAGVNTVLCNSINIIIVLSEIAENCLEFHC